MIFLQIKNPSRDLLHKENVTLYPHPYTLSLHIKTINGWKTLFIRVRTLPRLLGQSIISNHKFKRHLTHTHTIHFQGTKC